MATRRVHRPRVLRSPAVLFVVAAFIVFVLCFFIVAFSDDHGDMDWRVEALLGVVLLLISVAFRQRVVVDGGLVRDVRWLRTRTFRRADVERVELAHLTRGYAIDLVMRDGESERLHSLAGYAGRRTSRIERQFQLIEGWHAEPVEDTPVTP